MKWERKRCVGTEEVRRVRGLSEVEGDGGKWCGGR